MSGASKRKGKSQVLAFEASARSTQVAARLAAALARPAHSAQDIPPPANTQISAADVTAAMTEALEAPLAAPPAPIASPARAQAEMISLCLGLIGHERSVGDVLEQVQLHGQSEAGLITALGALGISSDAAPMTAARAGDFPALAWLQSGDIAVVFSVSKTHVQLYDPAATDSRRDVALDLAGLTGGLIRIKTEIDQLAQRHSDTAASKHWF